MSEQMSPSERQGWHQTLARTWARYNGQKGTDKQLTRIMRQLNVSDLERMLSQRGYCVAHELLVRAS